MIARKRCQVNNSSLLQLGTKVPRKKRLPLPLRLCYHHGYIRGRVCGPGKLYRPVRRPRSSLMARFMTRVELHGYPSGEDYDTLHAAMAVEGFLRIILGDDGVWYELPHAEYWLDGFFTRDEVLAKARRAAATTGNSSSRVV